jgi:uspA domain protein
MKNILVPVDFSEKSNQAVEVAVNLATKNNAKVFLLHCVELPTKYVLHSTTEFPEVSFFLDIAKKNIEELLTKITQSHPDISITPIVETYTITDAVKDLIEKELIDFIIMGSTGATGAKEIFLGSNAEKVVRYAQIPVLVIKNSLNINNLKRIVFACDFSQKYQNAIQKAIDFADFVGAKIDFVYINTPYQFRTTREIKKLMTDFANSHPQINSHSLHMYNDLRIEDGIINFSEDFSSDLICTFPIKQSNLAHFFNGSISEDIVNHSDKSVLTIKL